MVKFKRKHNLYSLNNGEHTTLTQIFPQVAELKIMSNQMVQRQPQVFFPPLARQSLRRTIWVGASTASETSRRHMVCGLQVMSFAFRFAGKKFRLREYRNLFRTCFLLGKVCVLVSRWNSVLSSWETIKLKKENLNKKKNVNKYRVIDSGKSSADTVSLSTFT